MLSRHIPLLIVCANITLHLRNPDFVRRGILEIGPISCFCVRKDYFFNERTADVVKTSFSGLWADDRWRRLLCQRVELQIEHFVCVRKINDL